MRFVNVYYSGYFDEFPSRIRPQIPASKAELNMAQFYPVIRNPSKAASSYILTNNNNFDIMKITKALKSSQLSRANEQPENG